MANTTNPDRVRIWNSFLKLAWREAKAVSEKSSGTSSTRDFNPDGGTLPDAQFHVLSTLVLCNLAIEARANHLIEELAEKRAISRETADAAKHLPPKHKWFLLPTLAGVSKALDSDKPPHQAIAQICSLRNDLMHVDFADLEKRLPDPKTTLSLFKSFVEAMEDMNVVLGRITKARKAVLEIGRFGEASSQTSR